MTKKEFQKKVAELMGQLLDDHWDHRWDEGWREGPYQTDRFLLAMDEVYDELIKPIHKEGGREE